MKKIIVSNYVTIDGFFAGPNGEIDWFVWDEETAEYAKDLLHSIDIILFGRVTYELMASYWPVASPPNISTSTSGASARRLGLSGLTVWIHSRK
jgi:dihydrofolate reductase